MVVRDAGLVREQGGLSSAEAALLREELAGARNEARRVPALEAEVRGAPGEEGG